MSVSTAGAFFPVRSTFVAPGFFEPYVRGSGRRMSRDTTMPNEIEPRQYAAAMVSAVSMASIL